MNDGIAILILIMIFLFGGLLGYAIRSDIFPPECEEKELKGIHVECVHRECTIIINGKELGL